MKGHNYDGTVKYVAYDWEADSNMVVSGVTVPNPRYVNRTDNNMADARAYRAEIGQDGKLYILHEVSGGNHMFRYAPFNISQPVSIVGGDNYFTFSNTGTEVKIVLTKHNPADFSYIQAQQLTNRLLPPLSKGNTIFARYSGLRQIQRVEFTSQVQVPMACRLPSIINQENTREEHIYTYLVQIFKLVKFVHGFQVKELEEH